MTGYRIVRKTVCLATGFYYSSFGALLFFAPHAFWSRIAPIGPFNQHYARDVGQLFAATWNLVARAVSSPARFHPVVVLAALGSTLHAVSHFLDGVKSNRDLLSDILLALIAILLLAILPGSVRCAAQTY
jgi:hypothetical protein